jgi:CelD/BcsL family acetyltransferase involved in cellulose biosynthesis
MTHTVSPSLEIRILNDLISFAAIRADYEKLHSRIPDASIYQSYAYVYSVIDNLFNKKIFIVAVYENRELVGVVTFAHKAIFRKKILFSPLTKNDSFCSVLISDEREDIAKAMAECIKTSIRPALIYIPYYKTGDVGMKLISNSLLATGYFEKSWSQAISHQIYSNTGYMGYLSTKSKKSIHNIKTKINTLQREHPFSIQVNRQVSAEEIINALGNIQRRSWLARRGINFVDEFPLKPILIELHRSEICDFIELLIGGEPIAFYVTYRTKDTIYLMYTGLDESYAKYNVGSILLLHIIKVYFDAGFRFIDFSFGDAEYKRYWANKIVYYNRSVYYIGLIGYLMSWFPYQLEARIGRIKVVKNLYRKCRTAYKKIIT